MKPIDMPHGFQMFEVEQSVRESYVTTHLFRAGKALSVLWSQYRTWELFTKGSKAELVARWHIASKTKALIKHDRILRGEA